MDLEKWNDFDYDEPFHNFIKKTNKILLITKEIQPTINLIYNNRTKLKPKIVAFLVEK